MRLLSFLIGLMGIFATNTSSPTRSMNSTRTRAISVSPTITRSRAISVSSTDTASFTHTGTSSRTMMSSRGTSITGTNTRTMTATNTMTQTGTQSLTSTKMQMAVAPTPTDTPDTTYIAIGSIGGCLVLMTIVAIAIVVNNRPRKKLHYAPTMMNVPIPQYENPVSSRVLFAPHQVRGLTTTTD